MLHMETSWSQGRSACAVLRCITLCAPVGPVTEPVRWGVALWRNLTFGNYRSIQPLFFQVSFQVFHQLIAVFPLLLFLSCRSFQRWYQNVCSWRPHSHTRPSLFPPSALLAWPSGLRNWPRSWQRLCTSLPNTLPSRWRCIL